MPQALNHSVGVRPARTLWYHKGRRYFSMPYEVMLDWRLSHAERSVLVALASFVFQDDTVFPARAAIAERAGVDPSNVSRFTRRLEELGWVVKRQRAFQSVTYTLAVPAVIPPRPATVDGSTSTTETVSPTAATTEQEPRQGLAGSVRRLRPEDQIEMEYDEGSLDDELCAEDDWGDQYID